MYSIVNNICRLVQSGEVPDVKMEYFLNWKDNGDRFAIQHCFERLIENGQGAEACQLLFDEVYLVQKNNQLGWRYVQEELDYASDYFYRQQNMYKYLYATLVSRLPALVQKEYTRAVCDKYTAFLQLETAPEVRTNTGLQKLFNTIFPVQSNEKSKQERFLDKERKRYYNEEEQQLEKPPVTYSFIEYQVGDWRCSCGLLNGFRNRQSVCMACNTNCTLSIFDAINKGTIDILLHDVPVYLTVAASNGKQYTFLLLDIPLLFCITLQGSNIRFGAPGYFVIVPKKAQQVVITEIPENCTYDRQTDFLSIMEAIFSRTIRRSGKSLKYAMSKMLEKIIHTKDGSKKVAESLSNKFKGKLIKALLGKNSENNSTHTSQFSSTNSLKVAVVQNKMYLGKTLWVSRQALASPVQMPDLIDIHILSIPVKFTQRLNMVNGHERDHIDEFGIVKPGSLVQYNDVLVSLLSTPEYKEMTPEEKLLRAIFGESALTDEELEDGSAYWEKNSTGKIIFRKLYLAKNNTAGFYASCHQRLITEYSSPEIMGSDFFQPNEWARIILFIQSKIQPAIGDVLHTADKHPLVISGYLDELAQVMDLPAGVDAMYIKKKKAGQDHTVFTITEQELFTRNVRNVAAYTSQRRATGPYNMLSQQPEVYGKNDIAQFLGPKAILNLYKQGLYYLLYELLICRSDGVEARRQMQVILEAEGHFSVAALIPSESRLVLNHTNFLLAFRIHTKLLDERPRQLHFSILSDDVIQSLTFGEVTKPDTFNERTLQPERDGLFCQKIFGALRHYECECGKYKRERYKGVICDRCGVELMEKKDRAYRMGHIQLARPVFTRHLLPGNAADISAYLCCTPEAITAIFEFEKEVTRFVDSNGKYTIMILTLEETDEWLEKTSLPYNEVTHSMGAEGIQIIVDHLQQQGVTDPLLPLLQNAITRYVLVIPPEARPLVPLGNGNFRGSRLNDVYRQVINRNSHFRRLLEIKHTPKYLRNNYKELQEAVDALYGCNPAPDEKKEYKGLYDFIFDQRKNDLLYKSFDYTASTRLLVNPLLDIDECEIPLSIACKIFRPLLLHYLVTIKAVQPKAAAVVLDRGEIALEEAGTVLNKRPVLLFMYLEKQGHCFALQCRLSNVQALRVSSQLLAHLQWSLVGTNVKIIPPMGDESITEVQRLLPSYQLKKEEDESTATKTIAEDDLLLSFTTKEELLSKIGQQFPLSNLDEIWMGLR